MKPANSIWMRSSYTESAGTTAPQCCELSFNYFTVFLTGCSSLSDNRVCRVSFSREGHLRRDAFLADCFAHCATGKYICSICGYVYDPAEHDGVAFEDLPDDWKCPRCKQSKEKFNKA